MLTLILLGHSAACFVSDRVFSPFAVLVLFIFKCVMSYLYTNLPCVLPL